MGMERGWGPGWGGDGTEIRTGMGIGQGWGQGQKWGQGWGWDRLQYYKIASAEGWKISDEELKSQDAWDFFRSELAQPLTAPECGVTFAAEREKNNRRLQGMGWNYTQFTR